MRFALSTASSSWLLNLTDWLVIWQIVENARHVDMGNISRNMWMTMVKWFNRKNLDYVVSVWTVNWYVSHVKNLSILIFTWQRNITEIQLYSPGKICIHMTTWITSLSSKKQLPLKEKFHSKLDDCDRSDEDYEHVQKVMFSFFLTCR